MIYPDGSKSSHLTCYEASDFSAYKNEEQGAFAYFESEHIIYSNMTMVDNHKGFGATNGYINKDEYRNYISELNDNYIYGDSILPDCPQAGNGGFCKKYDKIGIIVSSITMGAKNPIETGDSALPPAHMHKPGCWGGKYLYHRNKFFNFKSSTSEGMKNSAIGLNKDAHDYTPIAEFYDTEFTDIDDGAMAFMTSPDPKKANVKDCGDFPCTGKHNVLL